jgi:hypothetical protein
MNEDQKKRVAGLDPTDVKNNQMGPLLKSLVSRNINYD